jgi:hypothetical protein
MMFNEIKSGDILCLSFLKGTPYVLYVGPELDLAQRNKLKCNDIRVPVIYLPEILDQLTKEAFQYNFPGIEMPESLSAEYIYEQIRAEFGKSVTPENRLIIKYDGDVLVIYDAKESFSLLISYLINKCDYPKYYDIIEKYSAYETLIDECRVIEPDIRFRMSSSAEICSKEYQILADDEFEEYMEDVTDEIQTYVKKWLINGCPPELILKIINKNISLSRLRITRQFDIFLVDYNMEIKMGPLPKTIFLFYLRHPEGVMFSHLQDYRKEILYIYGKVCTNDDPQKMEQSINRLINPFDNSINEKCSSVKRAFATKIADNIAANYYISGIQGERKGISLDRNLVQWECEL